MRISDWSSDVCSSDLVVQGALDTSADVNPRGRIEEAEIALYRVAEDGQVGGGVKTFGQATMLAVEMAERALNSGGHLSGITTGLEGLNSKIGGLHRSDRKSTRLNSSH